MNQYSDQWESMIRLACLWEATAKKLGNVHPGASFADLSYRDFVCAAEVSSPELAQAREFGVGAAVLRAVERTRTVLASNVNLGIALLIAPLAAVDASVSLQEGIGAVLNRLDQHDASEVYRAIRIAQPGGMGQVADQDVAEEPTGTLLEVMRLAAERDQIAAEYARGFTVVLEYSAEHFRASPVTYDEWDRAITHLQLRLLTRFGDSLIARKRGEAVSREVQRRAGQALQSWEASGPEHDDVKSFDAWLRDDGHRRNPGTTADLVAAILFAAFRDRHLDWRAARDALKTVSAEGIDLES